MLHPVMRQELKCDQCHDCPVQDDLRAGKRDGFCFGPTLSQPLIQTSAASCCLFSHPGARYICVMKPLTSISLANAAKLMLGVALLAAATGAAFAAWIDNGAGIFLSLVESGLSWCF